MTQDLCYAALTFASDTLKAGGHFICKFYQGAEDKKLQKLLEKMFSKVHREKPESSRSVCVVDLALTEIPFLIFMPPFLLHASSWLSAP